MTKKYNGIVRGKTIELDESPGLADGDRVRVELETAQDQKNWEEKAKNLAGSLADLPDSVDEDMDVILTLRKTAS